MQLYIDSYGAFLGVKKEMFWVKPKEGEGQLIASRKINCILLSPSVRVSTDALLLALENSISVLLLNTIGQTKGLVWSSQYGSVATIRKRQALFAQHPQGMLWIRDVLFQKIQNQHYILQQLHQNKHLNQREYLNAQKILEGMCLKLKDWIIHPSIDLKQTAASFRGWEGTASRVYFYCISQVIPKQYQFKKRHKHPAYDTFNACLNYAYGILYGMIEVALIKAGIDPYLGILHTDRHNKPTLVFDLIEQYRHWVDDLVIQLFIEEKMQVQHFEKTSKEGLWLQAKGKEIVVAAFTNSIHQVILYKGNKRKRKAHIDLDAARLASMFKFFNPNLSNL